MLVYAGELTTRDVIQYQGVTYVVCKDLVEFEKLIVVVVDKFKKKVIRELKYIAGVTFLGRLNKKV